MKDRTLEYTGMFCEEEVLYVGEDYQRLLRELINLVEESSPEADTLAVLLEEAISKVKITEREVSALISLIPLEDTQLPLEPLWVRNQQQKSFKRGKK